jgi:hypothetical protein
VFDVVLQLSPLEKVCHESGCELAWGAAGTGRAAVGVYFVSVAKGKRNGGWMCDKLHQGGGQGFDSV